MANNASKFNATNTYGTPEDDVTCEFAIVREECLPFSSVTCTADIYTGSDITTSGPTIVPVSAPTKNATSDSLRSAYVPHIPILFGLLLAMTSM